MTAPAKPQWRVILLALDQLVGAFIPSWFLPGCDEDATISSRLGRAARGDFGPAWSASRRVRVGVAVVDGVAWWVFGQADHCRVSIEEDEGLPLST
jgi:hypothetical protein